MSNKDQIKDKMLASINKIKSYRETGDFELTNLSSICPPEESLHPGIEDEEDTPQISHAHRSSEVILGESTIEVARNPPLLEEERRGEASRGYMTNTFV